MADNQFCEVEGCAAPAIAFALSVHRKIRACGAHLPELISKGLTLYELAAFPFIDSPADAATYEQQKRGRVQARTNITCLLAKLEEERNEAGQEIDLAETRTLNQVKGIYRAMKSKVETYYRRKLQEIEDLRKGLEECSQMKERQPNPSEHILIQQDLTKTPSLLFLSIIEPSTQDIFSSILKGFEHRQVSLKDWLFHLQEDGRRELLDSFPDEFVETTNLPMLQEMMISLKEAEKLGATGAAGEKLNSTLRQLETVRSRNEASGMTLAEGDWDAQKALFQASDCFAQAKATLNTSDNKEKSRLLLIKGLKAIYQKFVGSEEEMLGFLKYLNALVPFKSDTSIEALSTMMQQTLGFIRTCPFTGQLAPLELLFGDDGKVHVTRLAVDNALATYPQSEIPVYFFCMHFMCLRNPVPTIQMLSTFHITFPNNISVLVLLYYLSQTLATEGQIQVSEELFKRSFSALVAIDLNLPEITFIMFMTGLLLLDSDKTDQAYRYLTRSLGRFEEICWTPELDKIEQLIAEKCIGSQKLVELATLARGVIRQY